MDTEAIFGTNPVIFASTGVVAVAIQSLNSI